MDYSLSPSEWRDRVKNFAVKHLRLGLANIGGLYQPAPPSVEAAVALLVCAFKLGIRLFDVAPLYGFGLAEKMFGRAIAAALKEMGMTKNDIVVATKILRGLRLRDGVLDTTQPAFWHLDEPEASFVDFWQWDPTGVDTQLQGSLSRLGLANVEVSFHDIENGIMDTAKSDRPLCYADLDPVMDLLDVQRSFGRVTSIGFADKFDKPILALLPRWVAAGRPLHCMSTTYALGDHKVALEQTLPLCMEHGVPYRMAGPLMSRALVCDPETAQRVPGPDGVTRWYFVSMSGELQLATSAYEPWTDEQKEFFVRLWRIARQFGEQTPRAAALQFVLAHRGVAELVVGASSPERLHQYVVDINHQIDPRLWDAFRDAEIIHANAPTPPVLSV